MWFLRLFREFHELEARQMATARGAEALQQQLSECERNLQMATEARVNTERSYEFLRGELEILKLAHESEIDGLKRMIDFFAPSVGGRTVFGLAPDRKVEPEEKMEPLGAQNRRTLSRAAFDAFYREAQQRMSPNPNGEPPADFSQQPQ